MAKNDLYPICDNRCHTFESEMINKENDLRSKWFLKNEQRLIKNLRNEKLASQARIRMLERKEKERQEKARRRLAEKIAEQEMLTYRLPPWRPPDTDDSINLNFMKPIKPEVREALFEKELQSSIATNNYFHKRWKEPPENRYYYPQCASWIYGWRLKDFPEIPSSKFALKSGIKTEFFDHTSSLQRDPVSREIQTKNAKNFNELLTY